jgi:PilZ domain
MMLGKLSPRPQTTPSRRLTSRVPTPGDVWVYWKCHGQEDVSTVRDMSMGGLFIETPESRAEGVHVRLHFLVQEGQIRAEAVVRHTQAGKGLGLKFTALSEQDRPNLAALLTRLGGTHHSGGKS